MLSYASACFCPYTQLTIIASGRMMRPQVGVERKLTAILCADVYGYSRLMGGNEEATLVTLTAHRKIIDSLIEQHHGRFVNTAGDSVLAEFASVVEAVNCAVNIQIALKAENAKLPPERRMEFRIGVNLGDVMVEGDQIYGDGINVAARLENLADPGGICISGTVHEQIQDKLALGYKDSGEQTVKNIARPVHVWRVLLDGSASPRPEPGRASRRYWHAGVFSFVGVAIIASTIVIVQHLSLRPQPTHASIPPPSSAAIPAVQSLALPFPDKPSIAVLPLANVSGDPTQEYFSDGVTDQIITDLSKLPGLFVIDRNSSFTYKDKAVKVQEVSRELGVRLVLEGSARKTSDGVRIAVQLVDATTGANLWAERFDRPLRDIFAVQDEIVQKIVTTLDLEFKLGERGIPGWARTQGTDNLEAFDDVLRGAYYGWSGTQEGNAKARAMYQKAIELDPKYADAYVGVGWTYFMDAWAGWVEPSKEFPVGVHPDVVKSQERALERASEMVQKAITLNDSLPGAYQLLSQIEVYKGGHYDRGIADAERAISLDPNSAFGYFFLADDLDFAGKPEDAIASLNKALRLDPLNRDFYLVELAFAHALMGRYAEAVPLLKSHLARYPNELGGHWLLTVANVELGRMDQARAEVAEVRRLSPQLTVERERRAEEHGVGAWPLKNRALAERFLADMGKAGLK
jgi:adenylate cyclase